MVLGAKQLGGMGAKQPGLEIEAKRLVGKRRGGETLGAKRLVTFPRTPFQDCV